MTGSELIALLDAHDALVKACLDSSLTFEVFLLAYDAFPHNYSLNAQRAANEEERATLAPFRKRIAFHRRVAGILSQAGGDRDGGGVGAGRLAPAAALMRIRELAALYPQFQAEPDFRG